MLICEEAHRYVPDRGEAQYREAQDAVRRIAKEGRKYGLGLMLVSQRPSDVESTVLSQCNSWLILRLTNGADQDHVRRFLPDSLSGITRMLSSLGRREAIFVGEAAALPARIRIRELGVGQLPDSRDISFVGGWASAPMTAADISAAIDRWTPQSRRSHRGVWTSQKLVHDSIALSTTLPLCPRLHWHGTNDMPLTVTHSTVTDLARFLGLSTSVPRAHAV